MPLPAKFKRVRYPVWSIKTVTVLAIVVVTLTAALVYLLGKKSLFFETGLTLSIIAGGLFTFLAVGLYHGVKVKRWDLPGVDVQTVSMGRLTDGVGDLPSVGNLDGVGDDEGCLVAIVAVLVGAIAVFVLLLVLWLVINLGIVIWVFLLAALSWVFFLALRQVFAKSRVCRGKLGPSLGYALMYTALYTGWLFALVWIADGLLGRRLRGG